MKRKMLFMGKVHAERGDRMLVEFASRPREPVWLEKQDISAQSKRRRKPAKPPHCNGSHCDEQAPESNLR